MTIADVLHHARQQLEQEGIEDASIEAEALLCHVLRCPRSWLFAHLQDELAEDDNRAFQSLLARRLRHEPLAYLTGHREFYGLDLLCTPAALIPRPETELLVELTLAWAQERAPQGVGLTIVDVGTGNGAIAVAVAVHLPAARLVGIDRSRGALALARENARRHDVADRVAFVQGGLLGPVRGPVDVVVANLPYVPTRLYRKLPPEVRVHEPEEALHAGARGTALIEAFLEQAPAVLRADGLLLAEHAWNQGRRLREVARTAFPDARVETRRDLAGRERVLVVELATSAGRAGSAYLRS